MLKKSLGFKNETHNAGSLGMKVLCSPLLKWVLEAICSTATEVELDSFAKYENSMMPKKISVEFAGLVRAQHSLLVCNLIAVNEGLGYKNLAS